jgi:phospholipase C
MSQSEKQFTNVLDTFDHVVVLMLENRSFDNLLGYLYSQKYPAPREQQFEGVDGKNISNPIPPDWQFTDENGKLVTEVPVAPISDLELDLRHFSPPYPDPGEDYPHVNTQLFNPAYPLPFNQPPYNLPSPVYAPAMNGFVSDYIQNYIHTEFPDKRPPAPADFYEKYKYIMESYDPADLSVLSGLAREFAVFDHWFCSVPSETICNRNFWHAGTSWGHVINPGPPDDACDQDNWPNTDAWVENTAGCTLFSQLAKSTPNIGWKIYSDNKVPLCDTQRIPCRIFRFFSCLVPDWIRESFSKAFRDSKIAQIGLVKAIFDRLAVTGNLPLPVTPLLHLFNFFPQFDVGHPDLFNTLEGFKNDCANGQLPAYSFIEPNFFNPHNDMHPSTPGELVDGGPQKVSAVLLGEKLVWEIYNAIFTSPQLWDNTLLVITFDEHGGCHDHVCPPGKYGDHAVQPAAIATPPDLNGYTKWDNFDFDRLGVRVPMVMVSPYIQKNTIINTPMSHTSFLRTMREKWKLKSLSTREDASPCFHDTGLLWPTLWRKDMSEMPVFNKPCVPPDNTDYAKAVMTALAKAIMKLIQDQWNKAFPEAPSTTAMETHEHAAALLRHAVPRAKLRRAELGRPALTGPEQDGVLLLYAIAEELKNKKLR